MKTFLLSFFFAFTCIAANAKHNVPAMIFALNGDTLNGFIAINRKPCKLSYKALYKLGMKIEFTSLDGRKVDVKPHKIKGFAIICEKKHLVHKFESIALSQEIENSDLGYAGLFGGKEVLDTVFARVINDDGYLKHYDFTMYSSGFNSMGSPSGNIYQLHLLRKSDEAKAIILKTRPKLQKEQLSEYLGDCPKVKYILSIPEFSIKKSLALLISDYNTWYKKKHEGDN